jgi:hypothetical protein
MDSAKCIYGYLARMEHAVICVCTKEPDYSALPVQEFEWAHTVYKDVSKIIPNDAQLPLGKYVTLMHYFDANLYHDRFIGCSVTGILHLMNKTQLNGTRRSKQLSKKPLTDLSLLPPERVLIRSLISALRYVFLVFQFGIQVMFWRQQVHV